MELYPWILIDLRNLNSKLNRRNMESLKKGNEIDKGTNFPYMFIFLCRHRISSKLAETNSFWSN